MIKVMDPAGIELNQERANLLGQAYEAASIDLPDLKAWTPGNWGPNAAIDGELDSIVARTRDSERNNGLAASGIQTTVDNVVGTGFTMQSRPDYKAMGKTNAWARTFALEVEGMWRPYAGSKDFDVTRHSSFAWMTRLVFRTVLTSGAAIAIPYYLTDRRHRTCFMVVEPDRLVTPIEKTKEASEGTVRNGIEYNARGEAITYFLRKKHPGENVGGISITPHSIASGEVEAIPARTKFGRKRILHIFDRIRPGQGTGVPVLTAVLRQLRMLDRYQISELQAAVVNAMVAAFIETDLSPEMTAELFGGSATNYFEAKKEWQIAFQGGAILNLFPGTKLNSFIPARPNSSYDAFTTSLLRHTATSLNIPYEMLAKDFSKTNYSSARAAMLEAHRYFNSRRHAVIHDWCEEVYALWLQEKIMRGEIEAPDFVGNEWAYCKARWIGPGRGWVDPVKEAEAARLRMEIGVSSLADEAAEQGQDWEELHEQRKIERDLLKKDGFGYPMIQEPPAMAAVGGPGARPGAEPDAEDDEAADEATEE